MLTASDIAVAAGRTQMGDHPPGDLPDLAGLIGALDQKASDAIARSRTSGSADCRATAGETGEAAMPSGMRHTLIIWCTDTVALYIECLMVLIMFLFREEFEVDKLFGIFPRLLYPGWYQNHSNSR